MAIWDRLRKRLENDANDGDLDRPDLVRAVVDGILALRRRGATGEDVFPAGIIVRVTSPGSLETLRAFVADTSFDQEVDDRLRNELARPGDFPARRYAFAVGDQAVLLEEDPAPVLAILEIEGGDRAGTRYPVGTNRKEWRLGRGPWHSEQRLANDIVLADELRWVSRAAAVLRRAGSCFEVEARDQGELLLVLPRGGSPQRPAMTATRRVPVRPGDVLELGDGQGARIRVLVLPPEAP